MPRFITKRVLPNPQPEGDGAVLRTSIGSSELKSLNPFVMLNDFTMNPPSGFSDHPHRGFEAVTYMFRGGFAYQDFTGHKRTLYAGDVQWMSAGRGIIHSEMPGGEGPNEGIQLWINLPSHAKMTNPNCFEISSGEIKTAEGKGVEVQVIMGESMGVQSPMYTRTPTMFLDFTLEQGAQVHQPIPESWSAFVYIVEGEGLFGSLTSSPAAAHNVLVLSPGDGLSVWNKSSRPLRFVLVAGEPINEPIVQHGPFVMNTQAEITQTIEDYRHSRNGFEMAKHWRSQ